MNKTDLPIKHIKSTFPEEIPDAYIQGYVEFYKLKFKVTPDTLIPRPETELLVDEVLAHIGSDPMTDTTAQTPRMKKGRTLTVLDVGTGAGNIAISIAKNAPYIRAFATDVSEAALEVAKENAKLNKVDNRIFFIQGDLLSVIASPEGARQSQKPEEQIASSKTPRNDGGFSPDIIVTNLPYIPSSRIPYLDPSVKDFEPRVALDGGPDGFDLYRKLFQQIKEKFMYQGVKLAHLGGDIGRHIGNLKLIVCEIDYTHGELAMQEAQKYFPKAKVEVKTDLAHKQRILLIRF